MQELQPSEFYSISGFFEGIDHNAALVFSVIEGHSRGRVFVDRREAPSSAFLFHKGAYSYVGGSPNNDNFNQALETLIFNALLPSAKEKELVLFAFSDTWREKLDRLLGLHGAIRIQRMVFLFDPKKFAVHGNWRRRIPEGFCIQTVAERLAEAHPEYQPVIEPGTQRFGVCLMQGEEVVSACSAVCVGRREAEIDIHTAEAHQGKGYATLAACSFIEECLARGLTPSWSCWPFREASRALAVKLGFEPLPNVPAHYWAEMM